MTYESAYKKIQKLIADILDIEEENVLRNSKLTGELGKESLHLNSFDYVRIIVAIEEQFEIVVDYEVFFETVNDMIEYVISQTKL